MQLVRPPGRPTDRDEDSNRRSAGESDQPGDPPHHPHCLPQTHTFLAPAEAALLQHCCDVARELGMSHETLP